MNLREKIQLKIRANLEANEALSALLKHLPEIGVHVEKADVSICGIMIDIDNPSRGDTVRLMSALNAGKWNKEKGFNETINYVSAEPIVDGKHIRLWASEPPGSCRIVEEEVLVPAVHIPEHVEKRKRLVCSEPVPTEQAVAS